MFHKNDYVNYTTQGICKIEDIQLLKFGRGRDAATTSYTPSTRRA